MQQLPGRGTRKRFRLARNYIQEARGRITIHSNIGSRAARWIGSCSAAPALVLGPVGALALGAAVALPKAPAAAPAPATRTPRVGAVRSQLQVIREPRGSSVDVQACEIRSGGKGSIFALTGGHRVCLHLEHTLGNELVVSMRCDH